MRLTLGACKAGAVDLFLIVLFSQQSVEGAHSKSLRKSEVKAGEQNVSGEGVEGADGRVS